MQNYHPNYRSDIDGLRAVAILAVVLFHAFPDLIPGGFVGVDVFFVISGYLISTIILRSLESGRFSFSEFYVRRIRRIFPALIVVLGSVYALGWWLLNAEEFRLLGKHIAAGAGFVQNVVLEREADYFDVATALKPLMHLWSLSVEEQFYLLFPALLWLAKRVGINLKFGLMTLLLLSFALNVANVHEYPTTVFFAPQTRFWELWAGGMLALTNTRNLSPTTKSVMGWSGLVLVGASFFGLSEDYAFPGFWAAMPVVGTVLLICSGPSSWINHKLLSRPAMVQIGLISFPLYLWHWPLLSFLRIVEEGEPSWTWRCMAVGLSALLAWATYRWIERPLRFTSAPKAMVATLLISLFAVGCLGYSAYQRAGLDFRQPELRNVAKPTKGETAVGDGTFCQQLLPQFADMDCTSTAHSDIPKIALLGDSHAAHVFPGLAEALPSSASLVNLGCGGCLPFQGVTGSAGNESLKKSKQMQRVLDWVTTTKEVRLVILASRGPMYLTGKGYRETRKNIKLQLVDQPQIQDQHEVFERGLRDTLHRLQSAGKKVIFMLDIPELGFNPKACINSRPVRLHEQRNTANCAVSKADFAQRNDVYRTLVQTVAREFPSVTVFDAAAPFCDNLWCWGLRDSVIYYSDNNHLTQQGSRLLAQTFTPVVQNLIESEPTH